MASLHSSAETDPREPYHPREQGLWAAHFSNLMGKLEANRNTVASVLGSKVSQLSLFRSPGGGSVPHWPAQHRCQRPSRRVAPPQQTRRPLAGSSGHREPQVPAGRRDWRARFPAGRSLSSRRPRPAPTWLNQARLCLADLNIWIPARPLPRPSQAGPPSHQRTPGSPSALGPQLAPQVVCLGTCPSSQHALRLRQEDRREVKANLGYEVNSKLAWPTERPWLNKPNTKPVSPIYRWETWHPNAWAEPEFKFTLVICRVAGS